MNYRNMQYSECSYCRIHSLLTTACTHKVEPNVKIKHQHSATFCGAEKVVELASERRLRGIIT